MYKEVYFSMSTIPYIFYLPQNTQSLSFTLLYAQDTGLDASTCWCLVDSLRMENSVRKLEEGAVESEDRMGSTGRVFIFLATFLSCHLELVESLLSSVKSSHYNSPGVSNNCSLFSSQGQ